MSTVYVVCEPFIGGNRAYDISPSMQYGQPEMIFTHEDMPGNNPTRALFKARQKLRSFNPMEDYVLWAGGAPLALALVSAELGAMHGGFRFLRWERERNGTERTGRGFYVPAWVDLSGQYIRRESIG